MIEEIRCDKKQYLSLLLLADEQEDMIDRYLEMGTMYALFDGDLKSECVVTDEGNGIIEIKNLATCPEYQNKGYARRLIDYVAKTYGQSHSILQVGTGDGSSTVRFYEKCGFTRSHVVKNFFTDNYHNPIYEDGIRLVDMVYLRKALASYAKGLDKK